MKKDKAKKENKDSGYTATEVGTMLKNIEKSVTLIAEGHSDLDKRLEHLEVEVHGNSSRLNMVELTVRITNDKVSHLENAVSKLNKDLNETREELKTEITATKVQLRKEIADMKTELKADIRDLGNRLTSVESGN